ncbi:MAG: hypothetical protein MK035_07520 [Dehalococcoidia bacterium]|nr:hypothetical protein [Dehalococcoidia bacterium]
MAQDTIFRKIREEAGGRELSVRWYRNKIKALAPRITGPELLSEAEKKKITARPNYGMMNLFWYKPLNAKRLKYYDLYPLVIPFKKHRNGFTGLNFHYLSVPMRMNLLERLSAFEDSGTLYSLDVNDIDQLLAFEWMEVKGMKGIKPIVRRYLANYVYSNFLKIGLEDMVVASLLPVERFYTGDLWDDRMDRVNPRRVWDASRRTLNMS